MKKTTWLAALCGLLLSLGAMPVQAGNNANDPVGTWLVEVSFPALPPGAPPETPEPPPPFMEFLTFHHNGTLAETNGSLHANPVPLAPLNLTASDGFGSWERIGGGKIRFSFLKMVFCGPGFEHSTDEALAGLGCLFPGQHLGYLSVRAEATLRGDTYSGGQSSIELLLSTDLSSPAIPRVSFGSANSAGKRIPVQAP
ncbi:hypothetical protein [Thioalkalivibrio sp. XN279]|uniref:hypothetical protein n=1 Tax=Thioalkalivibrio sp. XN279 TaxID=2714953 RepID=UPI0014096349|nr:hypothetical protein [Thioalkalivibrio sp. XN279]NHA14353.1 hypothetical protein [Thioalkalivibrio sp. XN279]